MSKQLRYKTIGLMSGTSLDGLDIAYCEFILNDGKWSFDIKHGKTFPYSEEWRNRLKNAHNISEDELNKLDIEFGHYLGMQTASFIQKYQLKPDLVASHGHTVFHKPEKGYTLQIGNGEALHSHLSCSLVYDFRTQDVELGGQGAPLVPIGDQLLFKEYDACINIGGFANVSMNIDGKRMAWDICPANIIMNPIAERLGYAYDVDGDWAKEGILNDALLKELNALSYYNQIAPKSLGKEWVIKNIDPILKKYKIPEKDLLHTMVEHISYQVSQDIKLTSGEFLFTGGGVFNQFLMKRIQDKTQANVVIPSPKKIDYKEALIFAFMGLLRLRNENNVLASVTGAKDDHSSGKVIL
ncbi:MAG: anhydro-N-acetylmuramic acid kinase [Bacteroidales bacterium]|nr:anhydro-N-acetylmuramic acid kinase [Bacteroidales bacterium]